MMQKVRISAEIDIQKSPYLIHDKLEISARRIKKESLNLIQT